MDTIEAAGHAGRGRRRHSAEFKAQLVQACRQPGVSIASVALSHGVNANLLRRWLMQRSTAPAVAAPSPMPTVVGAMPGGAGQFLPVKLEDGRATAADIRIELRRGPTSVSVNWPLQQAGACAAWLREWLR